MVDDSSTLFFINPESSMTTSNGYSIALFAHYLNNVYSNGDGTIIRQIWEELDLIEGGCGITCGIDSIKNVFKDWIKGPLGIFLFGSKLLLLKELFCIQASSALYSIVRIYSLTVYSNEKRGKQSGKRKIIRIWIKR